MIIYNLFSIGKLVFIFLDEECMNFLEYFYKLRFIILKYYM